MDGAARTALPLIRTCRTSDTEVSRAIPQICAALACDPALVVLFATPAADTDALIRNASAAFPDAAVIGCTTAGEIAGSGYTEGEIVAAAFPRSHFAIEVVELPLEDFEPRLAAPPLLRATARLAEAAPDWETCFALHLIDGLSLKEDVVAAAVSSALGPIPFIGGSAGDGLDFKATRVFSGGVARSGTAVVALVRTSCRAEIFKIDNLTPTDRKMVVTGADPATRRVTEINAEPAAKEYARVLGKDPDQLSPFTFAAHPLLVRIGDQHHVRAIQQVAPNGDLIFFSAIDEGLVLTLAEADEIVEHLDRQLACLSRDAAPEMILAFDCILRRLDAEQRQAAGALSEVLSRHRILGFSTYGEQINGAHVNQTLTGVALYAPEG